MIAESTVWGLTPTQLHDRYWAARGVQVVRQGEPYEIVDGAELYLLTDARTLAMVNLSNLLNQFYWANPELLYIRVRDRREQGYRERAVLDRHQRFLRFERLYGGSDARLARVCLTRDPELARQWQTASEPRTGWRHLRSSVPRRCRFAVPVEGRVYNRLIDGDLRDFTRHLVQTWRRPGATIPRAVGSASNTWSDPDARIEPGVRFVGPTWIGAGCRIGAGETVIGPNIIWDDPASRPAAQDLAWEDIEPTRLTPAGPVPRRPGSTLDRAAKRAFDITFALVALVLTLPLYPFVMLAIWLEDGRPFFFAHRRETLGGREFPCLKFRSMRKDAEKIKAELARLNQADGPQFFMEHDPRLTAVGRIIRALNVDELPQFINVLLGHMSVVGPRPSPRRENQFCPAWREARLSVRPGITGLWQVKRTREPGTDFQEWIKYDIEYVERSDWKLDLAILWQTIAVLFFKGIKS